ncbi:radical SAM protein [Chloroflexota bacterium]
MSGEENMPSRREEMERMFNKYHEVPREVIIQNDVQRLGISYTKAALKAAQGVTPTKRNYLFLRARVTPEQMKPGEFFAVPDTIWITRGIYGLRGRSGIRSFLNPDSPYIVDVIDGKLVFCERVKEARVPIAEVKYPVIPKWYTKKFPDGTLYGEVNHTSAFLICQRWERNEQCKFCDINKNFEVLKKVRGDKAKVVVDKEILATVLEAQVFTERLPGEILSYHHNILISGGTILTEVNGLSEEEFYLQYVEAVRERIGNRWPISVATAPKPKEVAKKMRERGVTAHDVNLEVWDKRLFEIICPGKARQVGWEEWVRMMIEEVDVFGEGNVSPAFVKGVEMCQPYGFKTVEEAVKSTTEGYEYLMSHGVIPRPVTWYVEPGSALNDNIPPPLELLVRLDLAWYETWKKYELPPLRRFDIMGPGRDIDSGHSFAGMGEPCSYEDSFGEAKD